jgi:hypothetical protein
MQIDELNKIEINRISMPMFDIGIPQMILFEHFIDNTTLGQWMINNNLQMSYTMSSVDNSMVIYGYMDNNKTMEFQLKFG